MANLKVICSSLLILLFTSSIALGDEREPASAAPARKGSPIYYVPYIPPPPSKPTPPRLHRFVFSALAGFDLLTSGLQEIETPSFGASVAYVATPVWTLGISGQLLNTTPEDVSKAAGTTSTLTLLLATLDYHFPGLESLYLGGRVGVGLRNSIFSTPLSGNTTTTNLAFGGLVGWRFQIIDALSLSPQVGAYRITTAEPFMDMFFQLAIQYWP